VSDPLAQLARDAKAKEKADRKVRLAIAAALDAGHTYADVARAAGISRQAVRQQVTRQP
jgi:transposase-like protein